MYSASHWFVQMEMPVPQHWYLVTISWVEVNILLSNILCRFMNRPFDKKEGQWKAAGKELTDERV